MSALTIDRLMPQKPASRHRSAARLDRSRQGCAGLAWETAGRIVLDRPKTVSFIVIALALMLGSLAGIGLGGVGRAEPPPLVRLVKLKPHLGPIDAVGPAARESCQPSQHANCRGGASASGPER